jgi:hypothetical protein
MRGAVRRVRLWKWRGSSSRSAAEELIKECDAFLTGQLGEIFPRNGVPKPPWVWLNQLAHGDLVQVEELLRAARPGRLRRRGRRRRAAGSPTWPEAVGAVAEELLWFAGPDPSELRRLQVGLVRLELELSKERPGIWLTPDMLMRRGLDALWTDLADEERGRVED